MARKSTSRASQEKAAEENAAEEKTAEEEAPAESAAPTSADRALAAVSHGAIILVPLAFVVSGIIWALRGRSSKYLASQSAQAFATHVIVVDVIPGVLYLMYRLLGDLALVGTLFAVIVWVVFAVAWIGTFLYGLYGAYKALKGEEFSYPGISDLVGS